MKTYVSLDEAQAMLDSSEADVRSLREAVRLLQDELLAQDVARASSEEVSEAKAVARVAEAVAKVTGDLQAALVRCADCEREIDTLKVAAEQQRKALNEAIVKAATEERLRLAAEKKPAKAAPAPAVAPILGYTVEGFRRDSNGDLASFNLMPRKAH